MYNYEGKGCYTFDLYPASLIPSDFTACTVMSILDYDTAQSMADVAAKHVQVYPWLPAGTPNDPKSYMYLKVKLQDGSTTIIGTTWVRESTISKIVSQTAVVSIANVTASDIAKIRNALVSNGFTSINIVMQ